MSSRLRHRRRGAAPLDGGDVGDEALAPGPGFLLFVAVVAVVCVLMFITGGRAPAAADDAAPPAEAAARDAGGGGASLRRRRESGDKTPFLPDFTDLSSSQRDGGDAVQFCLPETTHDCRYTVAGFAQAAAAAPGKSQWELEVRATRGRGKVIGRFSCERTWLLHEPVLTVVVAVFKGERFLPQFLAQLERQTIFPLLEIVFVRVPSVEREVPMLRRFMRKHGARVSLIEMNVDPGLYETWNLVIRHVSRAPFVTNFNVDDRKHPESLAKKVAVLQERPRVDVVGSHTLVTRQPLLTFEAARDREDSETWYVDKSGDLTLADMFKFDDRGLPVGSENIPHNAPVWRRRLHRDVGFFDSALSPVSDWALWLRALSKGHRVHIIPELLELYYWNPSGCERNDRCGDEREAMARVLELYPTVRRP